MESNCCGVQAVLGLIVILKINYDYSFFKNSHLSMKFSFFLEHMHFRIILCSYLSGLYFQEIKYTSLYVQTSHMQD